MEELGHISSLLECRGRCLHSPVHCLEPPPKIQQRLFRLHIVAEKLGGSPCRHYNRGLWCDREFLLKGGFLLTIQEGVHSRLPRFLDRPGRSSQVPACVSQGRHPIRVSKFWMHILQVLRYLHLWFGPASRQWTPLLVPFGCHFSLLFRDDDDPLLPLPLPGCFLQSMYM